MLSLPPLHPLLKKSPGSRQGGVTSCVLLLRNILLPFSGSIHQPGFHSLKICTLITPFVPLCLLLSPSDPHCPPLTPTVPLCPLCPPLLLSVFQPGFHLYNTCTPLPPLSHYITFDKNRCKNVTVPLILKTKYVSKRPLQNQ